MDKIHDRANKFINEVRKKKIKVGNINICKDNKDREKADIRNISDLAQNSCLFCEKVFISSNYLMKHCYRRHSDNLIKLHKRCILLDSSNAIDVKNLFTFLEKEFSVLKNELSTVKQVIGHKVHKREVEEKPEEFHKESVDSVRHISKSCIDNDTVVADIDSSEIDLLKEKVFNIESNIQCLHNKFEEFNSIIKTGGLFGRDIHKHKVLNEEKFLREQELQLIELRQILLKELKNTLSNELRENNLQWKSKFAELKHDILRLDHVIASLKKQIDSPDYLAVVEKRLEQHIINFLGSPRRKAAKRRNSRVRNKLSLSKGHNASEDTKILETDTSDNQVTNSSKPKSVNLRYNLESNKSYISPEELSFLIAEKLSHFNISHTTSRLTSTEYEERLKLINSMKDNLSKKYHNFSEIYKSINMCADYRVLSKLRSKKSRKLRFSEPLTSSEVMPCNLRLNEAGFLNNTYPLLEDKNERFASEFPKIPPCDIKSTKVHEKQRFAAPRSEGFVFSDIGGGGECSGNFPGINHNSVKEAFVCTFAKEYKTSSPMVDIHSSGEENCINQRDSIDLHVSSIAYKNIDCAAAEEKNTCMLDDCRKQEVPFFKSLKLYDKTELNDKCMELDDFDINSLESLSSWEDEENSCAKDELQ